jgi:hypothetical protein
MREAPAALPRAAINPFLRERYGLIPQLEKELGEKPIEARYPGRPCRRKAAKRMPT